MTGQQTQRSMSQPAEGATFDELLSRKLTPRESTVFKALDDMVERLAAVLPAPVRSEAPRLIARAKVTFARNPKLQEAHESQFFKCVLEAAELGLAVDGILAHAVPYMNQKTQRTDIQLILDWKGLVAVVRDALKPRNIFPKIVWDGDEFEHGVRNGEPFLVHKEHGGKTIRGAYAVISFHGGAWDYEWMDAEQLEEIRCVSKAKNQGPWVDWPDEMKRKSPVRRLLKRYIGDARIRRALELDQEAELNGSYEPSAVQLPSLGETLAAQAAKEPVPQSVYPAGTKRRPGRPRKEIAEPSPPAEAATAPQEPEEEKIDPALAAHEATENEEAEPVDPVMERNVAMFRIHDISKRLSADQRATIRRELGIAPEIPVSSWGLDALNAAVDKAKAMLGEMI